MEPNIQGMEKRGFFSEFKIRKPRTKFDGKTFSCVNRLLLFITVVVVF